MHAVALIMVFNSRKHVILQMHFVVTKCARKRKQIGSAGPEGFPSPRLSRPFSACTRPDSADVIARSGRGRRDDAGPLSIDHARETTVTFFPPVK